MKHFFIVIMVAVLVLPISATFGQPPQTISYQGLLTTSFGTPLNGTYDLTFNLYSTSTGGTALWTETHLGVLVQSGTFSVTLGGTTSLSSIDFSQQLYLGITEGTNPEFSPRAALTSAPSAFVSNAISGNGNVVTTGTVDASGQSSKIRFYYDTFASFPSATTYHGMFAHAHDLGKAYFAHEGTWVPLALEVHKHSALAASDGSPDPAVSVDAGGNIGIGTTSPTKKLEVSGSVKVTDTVFASNVSSNSPLRLQTGGTTRMYIDDGTGNIGVGTASPISPLHVKCGTFDGVARIEWNGTLNENPQSSLNLKATTSGDMVDGFGSGMYFSIEDNSGIPNTIGFINALRDGADNSGALSFVTLNTGNGFERMRITKNGNIGIGTTFPSKKLEITGSVKVSDTVFTSNVSSNSSLRLQTAGTTRMTFDDVSGRAGIGTSPSTYSVLHVLNTGTNNNAISLPGAFYFGEIGVSGSSPNAQYGIGLFGEANGLGGNGVIGTARNGGVGSPWGVVGIVDSGDAVVGYRVGNVGRAGYFVGDVTVTGTLSKGGGSFQIDHPLDPQNKYLYHSFVESPDMMNVYNGNVTTDSRGLATVTLPAYFEALNRDFRYQLTVIGQFAQAIVDRKVRDNQFTIKTDKPNVEVSWQVTGIRQDAFAKTHPIIPEVDKAPEERGYYLYPKEHGKPESMRLAPKKLREFRDQ